ncbi:MAG: sigma-70 family RNA polymerase sigma factor [Planctomycetota bacterium]
MAAQPIITELGGKTAGPPPRPYPPAPRVLETLSPDERLVLGHFLSESVEYMDHPALHEGQAEVTLFGSPASPAAIRGCLPPLAGTRPANGGSLPTLTIAQERHLFLRYNYARMRICTLREPFAGKPLTAKAVRELLRWAHRALDERGLIAQTNLPLVMAMAKRTRLVSIDYNELISEGNMALLRSVDKFDCSRGYKFSTYACRAILKSFSRVAMRTSRYRGRFPIEFDPAIERSDYLERKRETIEIDCVDELKEILLRNLADLNDIERTVIHARFALGAPAGASAGPKTLEEVGLLIGVTKERVRQIQNKALRKIRAALEEKYLAA